MIKAAMSGVPVTLQDAQTTGNGEVIATAPSITNHTLLITGNDIPSVGAVQPQVSVDNTNWADMGGGPITLIDGTIEYNFIGVFPFIRCKISTTVTSGSATVKYVGGHA